jgi:hypothetical protein
MNNLATPLGSVHAMKTEIPPFDSEIKDQLIPNDSYSHYYNDSYSHYCSDLWEFESQTRSYAKITSSLELTAGQEMEIP